MKKYILILFSILMSLGCRCQVDNNRLLRTFVSDSDFCKYIIRCKSCDTIHIVDTIGYFTQDPQLWRNIVVTKEFITQAQRKNDTALFSRYACYNMFITGIVRNKNLYRISYFHKPSNGVGFIEYKLKKNKLMKVKFQYGQL